MSSKKQTSSLQERAKVLPKVAIDVNNVDAEFVVRINNGKMLLGQVILRPEVIEWGYEDGHDVFEIKFHQQTVK